MTLQKKEKDNESSKSSPSIGTTASQISHDFETLSEYFDFV
eukprot:CAMPEP_0171319680 /NCGR_PEP_ID=MMETSP0816-20121228/98473_1 /TAXON_ID=420281 /ORGANISM="Proboscia inermis, Strain CCAP1064/1" /LENGTH=40 /DNA_ID= /DNA_START= /DNA_END= /DNA_ORIENTATION=